MLLYHISKYIILNFIILYHIEVDVYILLISPELGQYHQISCVLSEDHYQMAAK
jgi:hypothetical protein